MKWKVGNSSWLMAVLALCVAIGSKGSPEKPKSARPRSQRVVLVTGAAGFIGFHISRQLVEGWGVKNVVGLDSFNSYYDIQLKKDRATVLLQLGVEVYEGDTCDEQLLHFLFHKYNFTDVVHMAAQAGVRYSLEDPQAYVFANYECFISLLNTLVHFPATLVYASSSSVYGKRASVPFSSAEALNAPGNLYAASKIMNEHLATAYCSQYGLQAIGLRFFTVYGPWGRPDMAAYKFAERIVTGLPVPLFDAGHHQLRRDFTYIDDIVGGVMAAVERRAERCGEAYNLGYGQPLVVEEMLIYLEKELGISAIIERQPLPPSDMLFTFADISLSKQVLGFSPKTSTAEGIHHFVKWFKQYYEDRMSWERSGRNNSRNTLLETFLREKEKEVSLALTVSISNENTNYQHRLSELRTRFKDVANSEGIPLPQLHKNSFVVYPGKESPGSTIIKAPGYRGNNQMMEARCRVTEQCIAFTSDGEFKNHLLPSGQWLDSSLDLFVADIDMCTADLHRCGPHSSCSSLGPGVYECSCKEGFVSVGQSCIEKYSTGQSSVVEEEWQLTDSLDGINWKSLVEKREFVFFPGLDSPGGDYLVVLEGEDVRKACQETDHCLAYNTNGILKHSLLPPQQWIHWTSDSQHGLYVLDVDYCQLGLEQCPSQSQCVRSAAGNYSCQCVLPYHVSQAGDCELQDPPQMKISVIVSVDHHHLEGVPTLLNSLCQQTAEMYQLDVYVVAVDMSSEEFLSYLSCHRLCSHLQVEVIPLESSSVSSLRRVVDSSESVGNLESAANFARFMIPELFPQLTHCLYIDTDIVVLGDVAEVWTQLISSENMIVAVPRSSVPYGGFFSKHVKQLFQKRYGKEFSDSEPSFNAGFWGMNLDLWRRKHMSSEVEYWIGEHAQQALWRFGTQPILLLLAHHQWDHLSLEWNVDGLGWNTQIPQLRLDSAKLLHWSGRRKPWLTDGLYPHLWISHYPTVCAGHGKCTRHQDSKSWTCECEIGFTGTFCDSSN